MFLGNTQKEEIIRELKFCSDKLLSEKLTMDVRNNGVNANCLDFTDADNQQVAIKIVDDTWLYSQQDKFFYDWNGNNERDVEDYKTDTICLSDYSESEIEEEVKYFYKSLQHLKDECKQDWKQIACECIFENQGD